MIKKREIDIFGIILGLVIGCLIGYFLGTKVGIAVEKDPPSQEEEKGYIYLLQIEKFSTYEEAKNYFDVLKAKSLEGIVVEKSKYFYIYGDIGRNSADLNDIKMIYENKGYKPKEVKEFILDFSNSVIDNEKEYQFWKDGIDNLIANLNDKSMIINDKYYEDIIDIEFISTLTMLEKIQNQFYKTKARLQVYQILCKKLI